MARRHLALVLLLALCSCERGKEKEDPAPPRKEREEPVVFKPKTLTCPHGIGLKAAGVGLLPMASTLCPPEVVLFGMAANGCAIGGSCDRPCSVTDRAYHNGKALDLTEKWAFQYDADGRPIQAERRKDDGQPRYYKWTWRNGRVIATENISSDGASTHTRFSYDSDYRRGEYEVDGTKYTVEFDGAGRLLRYGESTYVFEDERITGIRYRDETEPGARFEYDKAGQLTRAVAPLGLEMKYLYDVNGLVTAESSRHDSMTILSTHEHDERGRLLASVVEAEDISFQLEYDYECRQ